MTGQALRTTISLLLSLFVCQAAGAATFTVTKQADTQDGNCNADCSVREAVRAANQNPGLDTILLPAGTFTMSISGRGEDAGATGDFDIIDDAIVQGAGQDLTIVDGNFVDRVFDVFDDAGDGLVVTIRDLTITGGTCVCGGGIWSDGDLTVIGVRITNSDADSGGGICNSNELTLIDVTIDNNFATDWGGAIDNAFAVAHVFNSTFSNNIAGEDGGAVCNFNGFFEAENSTFAGNSAPNGGMFWNSGTGIFSFSTIANNGNAASQRAILNDGGTIQLGGTLLKNAPGGSCDTTVGVVSVGFNLDSGASCGLTAIGDQQGKNPKLDTLKDNGGPTQTMALLPGSPAIDAAASLDCPDADQRGESRPADGDDDGQTVCDIGAFEVQAAEPWAEALALGPDVVLAREGSVIVEVRDGDTAAQMKKHAFLGNGFTPVAAAIVPDATGNGIDEVAVAAIRDADGRYVVEYRNATGIAQTRKVWFGAGFTPVDLVVVPDADNNGVVELAVLAMRDSDGRAVAEIRNATGAPQMRRVWFNAGFTGHKLLLVPDADDNGVVELAAALTRNADGRAKAELRNAAGAPMTRSVWFNQDFEFIDLAFVPGATPKIGMLASRESDGRPVVEVRRLLQGTRIGNVFFFDASFTAIGLIVLSNQDNNNAPELAVLGERGDGRPVVDVKNAFGAANPVRMFFLDAAFDARQVIVIDDADGNQVSELGVLGRRISDDRYVIQRRNTSGNPATANIWFSP